jgi:glutamate-1-semialdehyde 2,1-aminomutase
MAKTVRLADGLREALTGAGVAGQVNVCGSLLTLFFADAPVRNYSDAKKADTTRFAAFHRAMLGKGILLPPSQFEAWFVSSAHSIADIESTLHAANASLRAG